MPLQRSTGDAHPGRSASDPCRKAVQRRSEAAENPLVDRLAGGLFRHHQPGPVSRRTGSPFGLPARTDGPGATLEGGWDRHAHPDPPRCPHWASK